MPGAKRYKQIFTTFSTGCLSQFSITMEGVNLRDIIRLSHKEVFVGLNIFASSCHTKEKLS